MKRIRSILAATDFSVEGRNAAHRAAQLAQQLGARLCLLHVVQSGSMVPLSGLFNRNLQERMLQARTALRRLADDIGGRYQLQAGYEVAMGDTFNELLRGAIGQDLVVIGHRGQSRFKRLVMGSTASRFLRCCPCDVLAVKQPATGPYSRLLVPYDFAPCAHAAVQTAQPLAPNGEMQVFHALGKAARAADGPEAKAAALPARAPIEQVASGSPPPQDENGARLRIRQELSELGVDGPGVEIALGRGTPVSATLRQAQAMEADLIVAGKQGTHTIARFLLGAVSRHLLVGADCDIMIVSPPQAQKQRAQVAGRSRGAGPQQVVTVVPDRAR